MDRIARVCTLIVVVLLFSQDLRAQDRSLVPADFGWGGMRAGERAAEGRRPLLVILLQFSDVRFDAGHTRSYYEDLFFGPGRLPGGPSVRGYFEEVSRGRFGWSRAGVVGPIQLPDNPMTPEDESRYAVARRPDWEATLDKSIALLGRSGRFDFRPYDTNRDGRVTQDELGIYLVGAAPESVADLGASRGRRVEIAGQGLVVEGLVSASQEGVGLATIAHELTHQLGGIDIYGSGGFNFQMSLMGPTILGSNDAHGQVFHLDPWHKMRLGWIRPQLVDLRAGGSCAVLASPSLRYVREREDALLFHRGDPREFFLVEFRNPAPWSYDGWALGRGIAIWHVRTDAAHDLLKVPSSTRPGGEDRFCFYLGAPAAMRGQGRLWDPRDGSIRVRWSNGTDAGWRLRVGTFGATSTVVEVEWDAAGPFRPRVRRPEVHTLRPGGGLVVMGRLGLPRGKRASLVPLGGGSAVDARLLVWSQSRAILAVPATARPGRYLLFLSTAERPDLRSYGGLIVVTR